MDQLDRDKIGDSFANEGITWKSNPPFAPYFGEVHETMIKAAKRAIHAILGNADINDEELLTAMIGAESLIDSRPLTYQSANPSDDVPLTLNHFLHGQIGSQFAPTTVKWNRVQPKEEMAPDSGAGPAFLALVAPRMVTGTRIPQEMGTAATRHPSGRRCIGSITRHIERKLATRKGSGSISGGRRTGTSC